MRILLVDDEEELVSALAERLQLRGLAADWTTSGEQALELARNQAYDVAVIDLKMPGMGGIELKKKLAAAFPALRFIFMSGHGSLSTFTSGIGEIGSEDYFLLKPVDISLLIDRLRELAK